MSDEPEEVRVTDWAAEVRQAMTDLGCSCGAEGVVEAAEIHTIGDVVHVGLSIMFHFDHAPGCVLAQMPTCGMN